MGTMNTRNISINELTTQMPDVAMHCDRVAKLVVIFGKHLGLSKSECKELYIAGKEHDLGKLFIDRAILNAPRRLTKEEIEAVNKHTSSEYLDMCTFSSDLSKKVALEHHMNSQDICFESQIIAICDVFDALTSKRSYNKDASGKEIKESTKGLSKEEALEIMMTDPRQEKLNKALLARFEEIIIPSEYEF